MLLPSRWICTTIEFILIFSQSILEAIIKGQCAVSIFHTRASYHGAEISTFYLGIGLVGSLVFCPFFFAFEFSTKAEHIATLRYQGCYKLTASVDGGEIKTVKEHLTHIRHLRSIEMSNI